MKYSHKNKGYTMVGAIVFLLLVVIMWTSVIRQVGVNLRLENHFRAQKSYYDGSIRALAWGLKLCETGLPPSSLYSCKMQVGQDGSQTFVVEFVKTSELHYRLTARPAVSGDESLPDAPPSFYSPPMPGQATNPNPPDGDMGISQTPTLGWTAGSDAASHDVYFGTSSSSPDFQGNQTGTTFTPGALARNTWYYWRIDERNASGITTGVVWSFRTGNSSTPPPGQATNPNPADGAGDISISTTVSWTAGSDAESHDVYFGTSSSSLVFQGNQAGTTFNPGTLLPDTTYYWRIDEINSAGVTTGVIWSFTTGSSSLPLPGQATNPNPTDGDMGISQTPTLGWTAGSNAASHDVYFGTSSSSPDFQGNQTGTTFNPGSLARNTWYYWRIDERNASGITTGVIWSFRTGNSSTPPPGQATNPNPADGTGNVSTNTTVSWTAGSDAASHDVYFGTSSSSLIFQGNQAGTTFNPGTLLPDTTYYWRIDEINSAGVTTGAIWSFTTGSASSSLPGQATNPNPADGDRDVSQTPALGWTAGSDTTSHDVYFGPSSSSPTFQGNQTGTTFTPGALSRNTWYYWRIDERNASGITTGEVWSFRTGSASLPPPGQATNPNPADGAGDISISTTVGWTAGSDATSHDVYFGTSSSPTFQGNQTGTTFNPGTLLPDTTYYWRIDEINSAGVTAGVIWSFTTGSASSPLPGQATNPNPADGDRGVSRTPVLSWTAGSNTTSHDVYFGTSSSSPDFQSNQTDTTFSPAGTLARNTWYYWSIDERNASGTTAGVIWSFRTGP